MGTFSIWHWLIVLLIVVMVFGTKKLKNMGGDLGSAVATLEGIVKEVQLPVGTTAFLSGQSEEMKDSFRSLQFVLVLAIFLGSLHPGWGPILKTGLVSFRFGT